MGLLHDTAAMQIPSWWSPLDQERFRQALVAAEPPQRVEPGTGGIAVLMLGRRYPSDDAAVRAVLGVWSEVEQIDAPHQTVAADARAQGLSTLRDAIIVWAQAWRPSLPLVTLAAQVRVALGPRLSPSASTPAPAAPAADELSVEKRRQRRLSATETVAQRKAERERIVLPLLDEVDWTPSRWATAAGVSKHVTLGYLDGKTTLRKTTRARIAYVLGKALQRSIHLPD